jgi:predicted nucleic acid-binding protein
MKISIALQHVSLLGVETAPFIYYTENRSGYVAKMRDIFAYQVSGKLQVIVSTIVLPESLIKPIQANDQTLISAYRNLFEYTAGITISPVNTVTAYRAAELRAKYSLLTPDALHVATAIVSGCHAFLTNDVGLKRVSEIPILILDELQLG